MNTKKLKTQIESNPKLFPFNARFWQINKVTNQPNVSIRIDEFGFSTEVVRPFSRPITLGIDYDAIK